MGHDSPEIVIRAMGRDSPKIVIRVMGHLAPLLSYGCLFHNKGEVIYFLPRCHCNCSICVCSCQKRFNFKICALFCIVWLKKYVPIFCKFRSKTKTWNNIVALKCTPYLFFLIYKLILVSNREWNRLYKTASHVLACVLHTLPLMSGMRGLCSCPLRKTVKEALVSCWAYCTHCMRGLCSCPPRKTVKEALGSCWAYCTHCLWCQAWEVPALVHWGRRSKKPWVVVGPTVHTAFDVRHERSRL